MTTSSDAWPVSSTFIFGMMDYFVFTDIVTQPKFTPIDFHNKEQEKRTPVTSKLENFHRFLTRQSKKV